MKKIALITAISVLITVVSSGYAQAATFTEIDDAGETFTTAQVTLLGSLPLESISGTLSGDADLFKIFLNGGQTFSATTINSDTFELPVDDLLDSPTEILKDPQLLLFNSSGKGVYANDDSFGLSQATLPSGGFSPAESGIYYLAISSFAYEPVSAGGNIFPDEPSNEFFAPTGPGGGLPLIGFEGTSTASGRYTIAVTGVQPVPEPTSTLGLLALGAWGVVSRLKDNRNKQKICKLCSKHR